MKLILIILGFLPIACRCSKPSNSEVATTMLDEIKKLKEEISSIKRDVDYLVVKKLLENPDIHKVQVALEKALQSQSVTVGCTQQLDENFKKLLDKVNLKVVQVAINNVTEDEQFFANSEKLLDNIEENLDQIRKDEELSSNQEKYRHLIVTYLDKTEYLFRFVDMQQYKILDIVNTSPYFNSSELLTRIKDDFVDPSANCLKVE